MATHDHEDYDYDYDYDAGKRACFRRFCLGGDEDGGHSYLLGDEEGRPESWLVAKLKKLRELSELVAGPKWKNLIRKMGKICNSTKRKTAVESRYSPESYALNFSASASAFASSPQEDQELLQSFSTRFANANFINDHQRRPE